MKAIMLGIFLTMSSFACELAASVFFKGTVVAVDDGDTVVVHGRNGDTKKIRFYGVDTPESAWPGRWAEQPYSQAAKSFTSSYLQNREVSVRLTGDVTYRREVGEVFYNGVSASKELVRVGLAWWNSKYAADDRELKKLEETARAKRYGLWRERNPTPPWEWRRRHQ